MLWLLTTLKLAPISEDSPEQEEDAARKSNSEREEINQDDETFSIDHVLDGDGGGARNMKQGTL